MTKVNYEPYYYHPKKKTKSRWKTILVMMILIIFSLTVLVVYRPYDDTATTYYAVYVDVVSSISSANSISTLVRARGGAGYVYQIDEGYSVITSIYDSETSATSVANSLRVDESNVGVYPITLKANLSSRARDILSTTQNAYSTLYTLSNDAVMGNVQEESAVNTINSLISSLESRYDEISSLGEYESNYVSAITDNQLAYLRHLLSEPTSPSAIRYAYSAILCCQT